MEKIRITDYFNNYDVKEEMEHDLEIMIKHLKLIKPFKKYETKTYYDETSKEYKCEIYDVTKLRTFEVTQENGNKYLIEVNGNDKKIMTHFTLQNIQNKINNASQIIKIKNIKSGKTIELPKVENVGGFSFEQNNV